MLGFESVGVLLAYAGSILAAILCIVYGAVNWNKSKETEKNEIEEEVEWEKKDPDLSGENGGNK